MKAWIEKLLDEDYPELDGMRRARLLTHFHHLLRARELRIQAAALEAGVRTYLVETDTPAERFALLALAEHPESPLVRSFVDDGPHDAY
jgi:hypothetical protein